MKALGKNLEALEDFTLKMDRCISDADFRRLYHRIVIQCAKRMKPGDFSAALQTATATMRTGA
jgi:hypothetical protein